MTTKKINLTIAERLAALRLFDEFKGSLTDTVAVFDDVKALVVSDEEWEAANLVKTPHENGSTTWKWDDEITPKDVELHTAGVDYLNKTIEQKSEAKQITLQDKALVSLAAKLI